MPLSKSDGGPFSVDKCPNPYFIFSSLVRASFRRCKKCPIFFLDIKKAFDKVSHFFLFHVLRKFNFKESFISWIKTFYTDVIGRVMNNGWISEKLLIGRGVRQGCPLSALLFNMVVEILACKIRQNKNTKGIDIISVDLGIDSLKISQYADDTTLFVESVNDIQYIMNEINDFGDYAGPKINWNKTEVMKLNTVDNFVHDNAIIYTDDQPVKYLGVYVGENKKLLQDLNWNVKIDKIRNVLNMWKMRDLTFYGRIIVLKMLASGLTNCIYRNCCTSTKTCFTDIEQTIILFLMELQKNKIKRK